MELTYIKIIFDRAMSFFQVIMVWQSWKNVCKMGLKPVTQILIRLHANIMFLIHVILTWQFLNWNILLCDSFILLKSFKQYMYIALVQNVCMFMHHHLHQMFGQLLISWMHDTESEKLPMSDAEPEFIFDNLYFCYLINLIGI